jgi:hypothetical protein
MLPLTDLTHFEPRKKKPGRQQITGIRAVVNLTGQLSKLSPELRRLAASIGF